MKKIFAGLLAGLFLWSCTSAVLPGGLVADKSESLSPVGEMDSGVFGGDNEMGGGRAGVVTAGEWCDLSHWDFWSDLMRKESAEPDVPGQEVAAPSVWTNQWGFYTENRVAVEVKAENRDAAAANIPVILLRGEVPVWETRTDNKGQANCWVNLFRNESLQSTEEFRLSVGGKIQEGAVQFTFFDSEVKVNRYTVETAEVSTKADIAFIVDATGSMGDEIDFLKKDLDDILARAKQQNANLALRTGAVFYRDSEDDYVTKVSPFSENVSVTRDFINNQQADGGGDYPEAVHSALEASLKELQWNGSARSRLAFMLLDAPAHNTDEVKESLHASIQDFARQGIRLIPILASGGNKECEFMLRCFAMATGGTYVFITNDSGVGNDHIEATVGEYEVEKLNDLICRLIVSYTE